MICQLLIYIPTKIVVVRDTFTFFFFHPKIKPCTITQSTIIVWFDSPPHVTDRMWPSLDYFFQDNNMVISLNISPKGDRNYQHVAVMGCGLPPLQACLRVHEWATARPWAFDELPPAEVCEELPLADKFEQPISFFRSIHLLLDWLLFCCFPF